MMMAFFCTSELSPFLYQLLSHSVQHYASIKRHDRSCMLSKKRNRDLRMKSKSVKRPPVIGIRSGRTCNSPILRSNKPCQGKALSYFCLRTSGGFLGGKSLIEDEERREIQEYYHK